LILLLKYNIVNNYFVVINNPAAKAGKCWIYIKEDLINWLRSQYDIACCHVQSGTPLNVLQELGGWSSYEMVQRYAHLAPAHLSDHAGCIDTPSNIVLSHSWHITIHNVYSHSLIFGSL
jgi:hypothetical protein